MKKNNSEELDFRKYVIKKLKRLQRRIRRIEKFLFEN
jgi:hypothetical protein